MITKSMMMMIKIDSFLTESKQGFIRRISRVASSTHYLLTLKLTYHMKKISSHKKLSSYKKKTFFPDSDGRAVSHNSQFSMYTFLFSVLPLRGLFSSIFGSDSL